MPTPFLEAIANERSWDPLHDESPSAKLRRMLFRGQTVYPATAIHIGASKGLPGAVAQNMEEWGFTFERIPAADGSGEKGFKLANRDHQPTERKKRQYGGPRRKPEPEPVEQKPERKRGDLSNEIRTALLAGEAFSSKSAMEHFKCSEGNLRRVVYSMEDEGYTFDSFQTELGKAWAIKPGSKALVKADRGSNGNGNGNGHRAPGTELVPFGAEANTLAVPLVPEFGSQVQVVGSYLDRDGVVSLMLRDENTEWLTTVDRTDVNEEEEEPEPANGRRRA